MKSPAQLGSLCAALLLVAAPARAATSVLATSGLWSAIGGSTEGRAVCGITTVGGDGRRINILQFDGDSSLKLELQKPQWAIPTDTPIQITIQFDEGQQVPSTATGTGMQVDLTMVPEQAIAFMRAFRNDRQIRVYFQSGNEPVWTGGLGGSGRAVDSFNACRARLAQSGGSQPYGAPASAPYQAAPVNTQPFATQPSGAGPAAPTPAAPTPPPPVDPNALPPLPNATTP